MPRAAAGAFRVRARDARKTIRRISALTKILIRLRRPDIYGLPPNPLFSDMTGKLYTPVSAPADLDDYLEIISGDRTYEYLF